MAVAIHSGLRQACICGQQCSQLRACAQHSRISHRVHGANQTLTSPACQAAGEVAQQAGSSYSDAPYGAPYRLANDPRVSQPAACMPAACMP